MNTKDIYEMRTVVAAVFLGIFSIFVLKALTSFEIIPGVSYVYNLQGPSIAPNMITVILFDWRGYDTLGEAFILITAVFTTGILFGRGVLGGDVKVRDTTATRQPFVVQKVFAAPLVFIIVAFGIVITLGGHITPGGGFQGGSVIATAFFLSVVVFGLRKNVFSLSHRSLETFEGVGALIYLCLGLAGLGLSGYYLYNVGADFYPGLGVAQWAVNLLSYPDATNAGIIPYLNIGIALKVLSGFCTIITVLMGAEKK
ncbi:MAG: MnhB domain-containing protein [Candidatus Methanofastidiosa archaeon]|nr:MnhB domain-containing protein [Candidatus Methanofastidiosa archaeon]